MPRHETIGSCCLASLCAVALAGCTTGTAMAPSVAKQREAPATRHESSRSGARQVSEVGRITLLYARSIHVEPLVRPISFASSGASYVLKSTAGLLGRLSIGLFGPGQIAAADRQDPGIGSMNLAAFERHLDRITGTRQSRGTIRFLVDGDEFFSRLESAVDDARHSIDIRTYIFDNDDYAVAFAGRLKRRSDDGVHVRVMFDSLGNMSALQTDPETLPAEFRPPLSIAQYLRADAGVQVRSTALQWLAGDHTKSIIIDRKLAFVGGMNIGREYRYDWHDLMMEVRGPVVDQLQFDTDKAWARAGPLGDLGNLVTFLRGKRSGAGDVGYPVRVLQTRNFDSDIYRAQVAAIRMSQKYIYLENAYLSDDRIRHELVRAQRRGVDVRVIFPASGNHGPMNASNRVTINELLKHGVRVYLYPGMTHIKAAVFDGWACLGSANYDKMSLKINRELNLATSDPQTVQRLLERVFLPDLEKSSRVTTPLAVGLGDRLAETAADEWL